MIDGEHLGENLGKVLLLITLDENGWPYVAMLGTLEVIAIDRRTIRIAPWNGSTTTENLRRNAKVTLIAVDEAMAYYVQGTARELARELDGFPGMSKIEVRVESLLEDNALDYEGSARITTGVRFENPRMDAAYIEHARGVLDSLRR